MNLEELEKFTRYGKIYSPFKKDAKYKNTSDLNQELPLIKWFVMEKVDGTNIRIILTKMDEEGKRDVFVGSRKTLFKLDDDDKQSKVYLDCLKDISIPKIKEYFSDRPSTIVLYGEGYGAGVQKGGIYSSTKKYRVFDIRIGEAYQDMSYVIKTCTDNQIPVVPFIADQHLTYNSCKGLLEEFPDTLIKEGTGGKNEGFIFKSEPVLKNKYGERLIFKIKHKDF